MGPKAETLPVSHPASRDLARSLIPAIESKPLCAETRLVIELDGGQHLANSDAYRRDRRKDALLQEHGYFVLRFLAEDVGTKLDLVLDTILRVLARRVREHVDIEQCETLRNSRSNPLREKR